MAYTRLDILQLLAQDKKPACECCRDKRYWTLTIDHINGGGTQHRREVANTSTWVLVAREVRSGKTLAQLLNDYRVMCQTCNYGARINNGRCPHTDERKIEKYVKTIKSRIKRLR